MKYDELTGFKCAVAVAVACLEDERPKGESIQPEAAAQYVSDVLEVLLSSAPVEATVEPMTYPRCCKIPLIISIDGHDACLYWYYPNATASEWLRNWKAPCSAWPKWKNGSLLDGGA